MIDTTTFWIATVLLGLGTFAIRFSFLGLLGKRQLPDWAQNHLKYLGVGVFPALVTPLILWPDATGGSVDPARLVAAAAALWAGMAVSVPAAVLAGMGSLWVLHAAF